MNSFHKFAQHGDPSADGRCRWCGKRLRTSQADSWVLKHFHAESCATQFGARFAELGRRLVVAPERTIAQVAEDMKAGRS